MNPDTTPDVAIAHDQFWTLGGAERVAIQMSRALDVPVYAGRVEDDVVPDDVEVREVIIRPYEDLLRDVPGVQGATTRADGRPVNVIDVGSL